MKRAIEIIRLDFPAVVVGGGAAGCLAAARLAGSGLRVGLVEKAFLSRSGCLAAGVNALNACVGRGRTPEDYVDYALKDAHGIARRDLLLSMAERLNSEVEFLESIGLGVHKDKEGGRLERGWRNVRVNGENIKPLLAAEVGRHENIVRLERTFVTRLLTDEDKLPANGGRILPGGGKLPADDDKILPWGGRLPTEDDNFQTQEIPSASKSKIVGLVAVSLERNAILLIATERILVSTGGAAGIYRSKNPATSAHDVWYSPFNTGAGLARGMEVGAEMTGLEMRFIALRCRDTLAPTGTLALGAGARQTNSLGEDYERAYGTTTSQRVLAVRRQNSLGNGPCFLSASLAPGDRTSLEKAYLNMRPSQTLKFYEQARANKNGGGDRQNFSGENPGRGELKVEIAASEPCVQGGHTAGGYWVDTNRRATVGGLWAAGDVAGGCPQKYVTGAMAEAEIAAADMAEDYRRRTGNAAGDKEASDSRLETQFLKTAAEILERMNWPAVRPGPGLAKKIKTLAEAKKEGPGRAVDFGWAEIEEALQETMDAYAGGLGRDYRYSSAELEQAEDRLRTIAETADGLAAGDFAELRRVWEVREKILVARNLVGHLKARKETRWPGFGEYADYPEAREEFFLHVNSRWRGDQVEIIKRPLVTADKYEHVAGGSDRDDARDDARDGRSKS
ncbi:MAG: FAD-binding protein [Deltaproteobacteria bacterium]|nr:FAD-binding protein [Deltaproteobacteria bacterium]